MRDNFVINNGLIMHNRKPIFCRGNQISCFDHLYTNCPAKILNCTTQKDVLSDHYAITFQYGNKHLHYSPKYKYRRDFSLLNKQNLIYGSDNNLYIDMVFEYDDPDIIVDILIKDVDSIINSITLVHRIHCCNR